jgi:hypothetical protein
MGVVDGTSGRRPRFEGEADPPSLLPSTVSHRLALLAAGIDSLALIVVLRVHWSDKAESTDYVENGGQSHITTS